MTYDIHITAAAERDLLRASDHIEFVLKNPKAADDLLDEAEAGINSLADFPDKLYDKNSYKIARNGKKYFIINSRSD